MGIGAIIFDTRFGTGIPPPRALLKNKSRRRERRRLNLYTLNYFDVIFCTDAGVK
jgi:hypothetical protein